MDDTDSIKKMNERNEFFQGKRGVRQLTWCPICGELLSKQTRPKRSCDNCFWIGMERGSYERVFAE